LLQMIHTGLSVSTKLGYSS